MTEHDLLEKEVKSFQDILFHMHDYYSPTRNF